MSASQFLHTNGRFEKTDPEVSERPIRRQYNAKYKLDVLRQADACSAGELGALLRREGLYYSYLTTWRKQREKGELEALSPKKRGRRAHTSNPLEGQLKELKRENKRLHRRIKRAETVIEVQKKLSEILGIPLDPQSDESEE